MVQLEDIIQETGGCGKYQILLAVIVHSIKCVICFSMLFMIYGAITPDWSCADVIETSNVTSQVAAFKSCIIYNGTSTCSQFSFEDTANTIVTKWNLVCDLDWVPSTITSVQMAGVFVGNIACGQVADLIGRKPPLFISLLFLIVANIISPFSTSWVMFATIRFFIGLAMGFEITVQYNIMSEFTLARWRTWVVAVPSWYIEVALFSLVAWLLNDWRHLHFVTAAIGVPLLATYWFVPESFRWYVGHNRMKDAENVIKKVARINGKSAPESSKIHSIDMVVSDRRDKKYTLLDVVRSKYLRQYTLLLIPCWFTLGLAGYGIQFGVSALSGSIYINVFVIGLIGSPIQIILIPLQNRFGRKKTAIFFYIICAVAAFVVAVTHYFRETDFRNNLSNAAAIISLLAINGCWSPVQTLTIELYPTVVRNIGYGFQNTMARIGAIIGPQLVFLDAKVAGIMYWICGISAVLSVLLLLPVPETLGADLSDKIHTNKTNVVTIETTDVTGDHTDAHVH